MRFWRRPQPQPATASHSQQQQTTPSQPASKPASQPATQPPAEVSYSHNSHSNAQPSAAKHSLPQPVGPRNPVPDSQPRIRIACGIRVSFHWLGRMQSSKAQCFLRRLRPALNSVAHPWLRRDAPNGIRLSRGSQGVAWGSDFAGFRDFGAGRPKRLIFVWKSGSALKR